MSWHGPLSYWDIQYILTSREARARRFLSPAGTSEAELPVPHTTARGTERSCVGEQASCSWWGFFGKKASPSCLQGSEGHMFHRYPQHSAAPRGCMPSSSCLQEQVEYQLLRKQASGKLWPIGNYVRHVWSLRTTDELAIPTLENRC